MSAIVAAGNGEAVTLAKANDAFGAIDVDLLEAACKKLVFQMLELHDSGLAMLDIVRETLAVGGGPPQPVKPIAEPRPYRFDIEFDGFAKRQRQALIAK